MNMATRQQVIEGFRKFVEYPPGAVMLISALVVLALVLFRGPIAAGYASFLSDLQQVKTDTSPPCTAGDVRSLAAAVNTAETSCVAHWLALDAGSGDQGPLLHAAVGTGNTTILYLLLTSGRFDPNATTGAGETPLHAAVRIGRPDMVCHLIAHGAQRHLPNRDAHTPVDLARDLSNPDLVALIEGDTCLPAE